VKKTKTMRKSRPAPVALDPNAPLPVDVDLHAALQAKLVMLASRPITPRSLLELEQMTRTTREMLAVGQDPRAMQKHGPNLGGDAIYTGVLAPSSGAENFGATVVRELMALMGAAKKSQPPEDSPETIIDTIARARLKGLHDVADMLTEKLTGKKFLKEPKEPVDLPPLILKKTSKSKTANGAPS